MDQPATARWTAAIARGDADAFGQFYQAWFDRVFALARSISRRDESFCLDAAQEVMLRVATKIRPLADERAVSAWMGRTVFTTVTDLVRRECRRGDHERRAMPASDSAPEPAQATEFAEHVVWLHDQLAGLDDRDRALLLARFGSDHTLAELGAELGISGHAAHGRIRRALQRLREAARRRDDDRA